nr:NB-ARC domains-containing protein [Tanacetum cinerariifolium]
MPCKPVLLVLDDVDDHEQLEALAGSHTWFCPGSLIIFTGKDKPLLRSHRVDEIHDMEFLDRYKSLQLFSLYAFEEKHSSTCFKVVSEKVVNYVQGHPLALKVFGHFLYGKTVGQWVSELDRLKLHPNEKIQRVLRLSYDGLNLHQQNILLDIACLFIGENNGFVASILDGCKFFADTNMKVLVDNSLVMISSNMSLQVHDLIQAMVALTEAVEVLVLSLENFSQKVHIDANDFAHMKKLRILKIYHEESIFQQKPELKGHNVMFTRNLYNLSNELSLFYWHGCPFKYLPSHFYPENIVAIDLSYNNIKHFWTTPKCFRRLKIMKLRYCCNLTTTPDFSEIINLEELNLEGCVNLVSVHPSIGMFKRLVVLNLRDSITELPSFVSSLTNLESLSFGGQGKIQPRWWTPITGAFGLQSKQQRPQRSLSLVGLQKLKSLNFRYLKDMTNEKNRDTSKKEVGTTSTPQFQCPILKPSNYSLWAIRMQIILEANGLWEMIEPNEKTEAENKRDKTAIAFLYQALPEDQLLQITKYKTAKAIWEALKTRHLGEERVQQARLQTLKSDFKMLQMKEYETIDAFTTKLTTLVNKAASLGHTMEDGTPVRKLLNVVPDRYLQIVASIEQYSDLSEMTLEEAIGRLKTYEERIKHKKGKQVDNQERLMFTRHENKGKYLRGRERGRNRFSQGKNHENFKEERKEGETSYRSYDKNNFKKSTYDTSKVKCYRCKKFGHIAPNCPLRIRPNEQSNLIEEDLEPTLLMAILKVEEQEVSLHEENVGYKETNMDSLRAPFPKKAKARSTSPLDLVYGDLCGPITPPTPSGKKYIFLLVDDYSRYMWEYFLNTKDQAFDTFKEFKKSIENELRTTLKMLRMDRGGEFTSKEFMQYCKENGIARQLTAPYSPQQNRVVERRNRTIMSTTRCMIKATSIPQNFWAEAVRHAIYILNSVPTKALEDITPYEAIRQRKPNLETLRVFGCIAYAKVPSQHLTKLVDRSIKMVYLGNEQGSKAYRLFDPITQRICVSRDVKFKVNETWD